MPSVLMLGIERAMSPSEALEALLTLQTMLVGDVASQVSLSFRRTTSVNNYPLTYLVVDNAGFVCCDGWLRSSLRYAAACGREPRLVGSVQ